MSGPISPKSAWKGSRIPDEVFDAFNELIVSGGGTVQQDEVVALIVAKMTAKDPAFERATIFRKGWLDVEPAYRRKGWRVEYDKPGYNETYGAYWRFAEKS